MPRMACRNTALLVPSAAIRYSSGRENTKVTRAGVKNGVRLSIVNAIELPDSRWVGARQRALRLPNWNVHFPDNTLSTLETFLRQAKKARVFRRAQAVRDVVTGQRLQTVSDTLHFTYSALRKWVHRFATEGTRGLVDRPAPGDRPKSPAHWHSPSIASSTKPPLEHGSLYSQWSCRELATVLARQTGVQLGRESVRGMLKKFANLLPPYRTARPYPCGPRVCLP